MTSVTVYEALEKQVETLRWYSDPKSIQFTSFDYGEETARRTHSQVKTTLKRAEPFWMGREISRLLTANVSSLPDTTTVLLDDLPTPYGWMLLEEPVALPVTAHGVDLPMHALAWCPIVVESLGTCASVTVFSIFRNSNGRPLLEGINSAAALKRFGISWVGLQHGAFTLFGPDTTLADMKQLRSTANSNTYNEILTDDQRTQAYAREAAVAAWAASALHFMKQRYVVLEQERPDRATARRWWREHAEELPIVKVVKLRVAEHKSHERTEDEPGYHWSVRSIRRQHWHSYWCQGGSSQCTGGGGRHTVRLEPRFVMATVCGPEGAPLKEQINLFAVVR